MITTKKVIEMLYNKAQVFKSQHINPLQEKITELEDIIVKHREVLDEQRLEIKSLKQQIEWLKEDIDVLPIQRYFMYPDKPKLTIGKALSALYKHFGLEVDLTDIAVVKREETKRNA